MGDTDSTIIVSQSGTPYRDIALTMPTNANAECTASTLLYHGKTTNQLFKGHKTVYK